MLDFTDWNDYEGAKVSKLVNSGSKNRRITPLGSRRGSQVRNQGIQINVISDSASSSDSNDSFYGKNMNIPNTISPNSSKVPSDDSFDDKNFILGPQKKVHTMRRGSADIMESLMIMPELQIMDEGVCYQYDKDFNEIKNKEKKNHLIPNNNFLGDNLGGKKKAKKNDDLLNMKFSFLDSEDENYRIDEFNKNNPMNNFKFTSYGQDLGSKSVLSNSSSDVEEELESPYLKNRNSSFKEKQNNSRRGSHAHIEVDCLDSNEPLNIQKEDFDKITSYYKSYQQEQADSGIFESQPTKTVSNFLDVVEKASNTQEQEEVQRKNSLMQNLSSLKYDSSYFDTESRFSQGATCRCQVLRSACNWSMGLQPSETENSIYNAYKELITKSQHFIYIENQFFISSTSGRPVSNNIVQSLVDRIIIAHKKQQQFKVLIALPLLPGFEGDIDNTKSAIMRIQISWQSRTISKGIDSLLQQLRSLGGIHNPSEYVRFIGLRTHAVSPNGNPCTEMVYIHSKCMVVDDRVAIIGSANINDRSMLGKRDSEIAMVVEDIETVDIKMGEKDYKVRKFAHELRKKCFRGLFGFSNDQDKFVENPLCPKLWDTIENRVMSNTSIYRRIFRPYPDNYITKIKEVRLFMSRANIDSYERLKDKILGFAVDFPLHFLKAERGGNVSTMQIGLLLVPSSTFT